MKTTTEGLLTIRFGSKAVCEDFPCKLIIEKGLQLSWGFASVPSGLSLDTLAAIMRESQPSLLVSFLVTNGGWECNGLAFLSQVKDAQEGAFIDVVGTGKLLGPQVSSITPA